MCRYPSSLSLSLSSLSYDLSRERWRGSGSSRAAGELVDRGCGLNSSGNTEIDVSSLLFSGSS